MISKEEVTRLGNQLGFEVVRFGSADPFPEYEQAVKKRIREDLYPPELMSYEKILEKAEIYANPSNSLPGAKSIISMAFCYYTDETSDLTRPGEPHGVLARSYQRDVYGEMYQRLNKVAEFLREKGIQVAEKSRIPQKMAAIRTGVGWQGKNSLVLTKEFGSWITLCSLVVDVEFEPDEPSPLSCGTCRACQRVCPTSAIQSPGVVNANKCIVYLTCKTGDIPEEFRHKMGKRLVSCDLCQEVCPHNKRVKPVKKEIDHFSPEFRHSPALIPLLGISKEEFRRDFLEHDFIDPRSEYLQRNVIVALGNVGDPVAVPPLKKLLTNGTPLLTRHATWALGQIDSKKTHNSLKDVNPQ